MPVKDHGRTLESGSCYFAKEPIGAWIEVFREHILLADNEVNRRSL